MSSITASWIPSTIVAGNTATLIWSSLGTFGVSFTGPGTTFPYPANSFNTASQTGSRALTSGSQEFYFASPGDYYVRYSTTENNSALNPVTGFANIVVSPIPTTTTTVAISATQTSVGYLDPITVTATVSPAPVLDGESMILYDNVVLLATNTITSGSTTFFLPNLVVGQHNLQAYYSGNLVTNYTGNSSANLVVAVTNASNVANVLSTTNGFISNGNIILSLVGLSAAANTLAFSTGGGTGSYANANVAVYLPSYTGNIAGNVSFGPGTSANLKAGNLIAAGFYFPNNQPFTSSLYADANVASYLPTYSGTVQSTNVYVTTGNITSTTGGNVAGNVIGRFGQFQSMKMLTSVQTGVGGAVVLDCGLYNSWRLTITGAITGFTISNPPPAGQLVTIYIFITYNGGTTVTWPSSFSWPNTTAPTLTVTTGTTDWISATTVDGGTKWFATVIGQAFA